MKTLIVLIGGFFLLSSSANAQNVSKKNATVESKQIVLAKKTPIKLTATSATSKPIATKKEEKAEIKKTVAIKPKK